MLTEFQQGIVVTLGVLFMLFILVIAVYMQVELWLEKKLDEEQKEKDRLFWERHNKDNKENKDG